MIDAGPFIALSFFAVTAGLIERLFCVVKAAHYCASLIGCVTALEW